VVGVPAKYRECGFGTFIGNASVCGVRGALFSWEIMDLVNPLGNHRFLELRRGYREFFPEGKHLKRLNVLGPRRFSRTLAAWLILVFAANKQWISMSDL
jgi:hypothetical protein